MKVPNVEVARRLAKIWKGAAERVSASGIGDAETGKSLVAAGLERWGAAEPPEMVAEGLGRLAMNFADIAAAEVGEEDGKPSPRH